MSKILHGNRKFFNHPILSPASLSVDGTASQTTQNGKNKAGNYQRRIMDVTLSSKAENNYLLIETQGNVVNSEEHKLLTLQFYNEIVKYGFDKIIIDVSKTNFPISVQFHNEIVKFYAEALPREIKLWKIAVIDASSYKEIGNYWQFIANQDGYNNFKVFASMTEAVTFISE